MVGHAQFRSRPSLRREFVLARKPPEAHEPGQMGTPLLRLADGIPHLERGMVEKSEAVREVVALWNQLPEEHRSDFIVCFALIRESMGVEWLTRHFDPDLKRPSVFKIGHGTSEEEATRNYRAIDLAECIINLKDIEGIQECLSRIKEAENPEAGYAELHIAKMLYINEWPFRFVTPRGKRGDDYDLEIVCYNQQRCGDTKCKLESTELSSSTITSTLKNSRDQLPPDGPGVFFIKIPQRWMANPDWQRITGKGAVDFFETGTQRVASVVFYVEPLQYQSGWLRQGHLYLEIMNPRHRLSRLYDWRLFERWKPPPVALNTMPPFWIRLSNFPTGLPNYRQG